MRARVLPAKPAISWEESHLNDKGVAAIAITKINVAIINKMK